MIRKEKVINIIPELYTSLATPGCGDVFYSGPHLVIEYFVHQNFILTWLVLVTLPAHCSVTTPVFIYNYTTTPEGNVFSSNVLKQLEC